MKRLICALIIILFVCACLPFSAGAALTPQDKELVMVTAIKADTGDYLLYRVFARQNASLPTSVTLKVEAGASPSDVQESNGIEWWPATYDKAGDTLTVNLTKGRIAEVKVAGGKHFTNNGDGTVSALVPLSAQVGIVNVQPGASIPAGMACISPPSVDVNSDFSTDLLVASVFMDLSRAGAPTEAVFVFGEQGAAFSPEQIAEDVAAATNQPGRCCWWPLVVLCVLFVLLSILYWFVREREEEAVEEPDELAHPAEDQIQHEEE